jgi:hypothetical protein
MVVRCGISGNLWENQAAKPKELSHGRGSSLFYFHSKSKPPIRAVGDRSFERQTVLKKADLTHRSPGIRAYPFIILSVQRTEGIHKPNSKSAHKRQRAWRAKVQKSSADYCGSEALIQHRGENPLFVSQGYHHAGQPAPFDPCNRRTGGVHGWATIAG